MAHTAGMNSYTFKPGFQGHVNLDRLDLGTMCKTVIKAAGTGWK